MLALGTRHTLPRGATSLTAERDGFSDPPADQLISLTTLRAGNGGHTFRRLSTMMQALAR